MTTSVDERLAGVSAWVVEEHGEGSAAGTRVGHQQAVFCGPPHCNLAAFIRNCNWWHRACLPSRSSASLLFSLAGRTVTPGRHSVTITHRQVCVTAECMLLTCAGVHAALLGDVVVLISSAASVGESFTAPHLAVVVPVVKHRPTRTDVRLCPTKLWVSKKHTVYQTVLDEMFYCRNRMKHLARTM